MLFVSGKPRFGECFCVVPTAETVVLRCGAGASNTISSLYSLSRRRPIKHLDTRALMIITRTPLRISIGGGGTDLPSYYRRFGGALISSAIDKYVFIGINKTFSAGYQIKYSTFENAPSIAEIHHPIVREALRLHNMPPSLEIISLA